MGLLWWRKGNKPQPQPEAKPSAASANGAETSKAVVEAPGMNGAVEVPRPTNAALSIFEFGSVAASADKVTLAGYCPVSEDLEPCRWEILPAIQSNAPQFRVVF
ncbi:hypothetical protein Fmac_002244 [Flemingia macrophylla]|uniref:Allyl alcohol dehydrogenase-like protein n=1 Tax=Flemingia macrophylla TaxID=520843 RepID=A0ABD1NJE6_9FABA